MREVRLQRTWELGAELNGGSFGKVYEVVAVDTPAVVKLVPQVPGASRELLFVDLADVPHVVPILDSGEFDGHWALVMPRADYSLRDRLQVNPQLERDQVLQTLTDIATGLEALRERGVVHRDLKPENVLHLDGGWCLADFGISRYAESATAADTHKWSMTPPYAAPEQWRSQRASSATDIYALGVMAYEMFAGSRPFPGPELPDYREQHLHYPPQPLLGVGPEISALVDDCLLKSASTRPRPAQLLTRLARIRNASESIAFAALADANRVVTAERAEQQAAAARRATENEERSERAQAAVATFDRISTALREAIVQGAPATTSRVEEGSWTLELGTAQLSLASNFPTGPASWGGWDPPAFRVDATARLTLKLTNPVSLNTYRGRSHSLWFGDIQEKDSFNWFETAFMDNPMMRKPFTGVVDPYALEPGEMAAKALWRGIAEYQLAWPFTVIDPDGLRDFVERWVERFAAAASGKLGRPTSMPELRPEGSWRSQ